MSKYVVHNGLDTLEIHFPFNDGLKNLVKDGVPRRRFDWDRKIWLAPQAEVVSVVDLLRPEGFEFDDETLALYAVEAAAEPDHWTVTRLNQAVQRALRGAFPEPVWLVGQLTDMDRARRVKAGRGGKSMLFFRVVEVEDGGKEVAKVACKLTDAALRRIMDKLARAGNPFDLTDETTVRLKGRVELYVPSGAYQVDVLDLDVNYTLGEVARRREAIKRTLRAEGLLDRNRAVPLSPLPLRIGLVTSAQSDAYNDVVKTLRESGYAFQVWLRS